MLIEKNKKKNPTEKGWIKNCLRNAIYTERIKRLRERKVEKKRKVIELRQLFYSFRD